MKRIYPGLILVYFFVSVVYLHGCATERPGLKVENSLPPDRLAYYNDSFETLRGDMWEMGGLTFNESQLANFKAADVSIRDGRLRIETKTGHFSKGGLISKYTLTGAL